MLLLNSEPYKHKGTDTTSEINTSRGGSGPLPHVQSSEIKRSFRGKGGKKTGTAEMYLQTCPSLISYLLSLAYLCKHDFTGGVCCGQATLWRAMKITTER